MTQNVARERTQPPVAPLRKRLPDGGLYCRPNEVETALTALLELSTHELIERSRIEDVDAPNYVLSECVLYFFRRPGLVDDALHDLFVILRQRVLRAVPVTARRLAGTAKLVEKSGEQEIQEVVIQKFQEMLCGDRGGEYDDRLDCFECRFNFALARLRSTARKRVWRDESRYESTDFTDNAGEASEEIESALAAMRNALNDEGVDFLYRSKLHTAINSLPPDQRRVIELIFQEVPIDSQEEGVTTIAKLVGCVEQTVRNRRDRAFKTLRDALKEEDDV